MISTTEIVGYLALFAAVGAGFIFVNLLAGRLLRPNAPNREKLEVYECGEPTIGSSFVQFDLRFYVIALLFIIFDVEVAFFFPWAVVFGKSTALMDERLPPAAATEVYREMGIRNPPVLPAKESAEATAARIADARQLARISIADIGVFFAVLLVGFAYVWRRGDLDWVRAVSRDRGFDDRTIPEIHLERPTLTVV
ncbi:MAG TPA: NADH-quinone oxidoreductase subunit A [Pirellulales bacterium]|nr:NADH-quinone oxidoreductase subunit A [Pirellulales bacterium]